MANFVKRKPNGYKLSNIYTIEHDIWQRRYKKLLDTAISSWSGFVYQGKVAIYHVLQEIDNDGYTLQLDSLDDFAILDGLGQIISMHQVKAKKSNNFSVYKEAFEKLQDGGSVVSCNNLFFHLAQAIGDKTFEEIETDFFPIKVYKYDDDLYCAVNQIDTQIESLIIRLMPACFPRDISKTTPEYAIKVRRCLDDLIVKKLLEIHRIIHLSLQPESEAAYQQRISFSEFEDILNTDLNQIELGEDYYFYLLKSDICRYYQEYCIDYENELEDSDLNRLNSIILQFEQLNKNDIVDFIRNIMPHRTFKFNTIKDYKDNSPNQDEIKNVFLYILHSIKQKPSYSENNFLQWNSGIKLFSPTCIIEGNSVRNKERICNNIVKNVLDMDLDILFESQNLITETLEVESILTPTVIGNYDGTEQHHIMKWKQVALVTLEVSKGEIDV